jgi:hypothetical protein
MRPALGSSFSSTLEVEAFLASAAAYSYQLVTECKSTRSESRTEKRIEIRPDTFQLFHTEAVGLGQNKVFKQQK